MFSGIQPAYPVAWSYTQKAGTAVNKLSRTSRNRDAEPEPVLVNLGITLVRDIALEAETWGESFFITNVYLILL